MISLAGCVVALFVSARLAAGQSPTCELDPTKKYGISPFMDNGAMEPWSSAGFGSYSFAMPLTGDQCGLYGVTQTGYYFREGDAQNPHGIGPQSVTYFAEYNQLLGFWAAYDNKTETMIDDQWTTQAQTPIVLFDPVDRNVTYMYFEVEMKDVLVRVPTKTNPLGNLVFKAAANRLVAETVMLNDTGSMIPTYNLTTWVIAKPPSISPPTPPTTWTGRFTGLGVAQVTVPVGPILFITVYIRLPNGITPGVKPVTAMFTNNATNGFPEQITGPSLQNITNITVSYINNTQTGELEYVQAIVVSPYGKKEIISVEQSYAGQSITATVTDPTAVPPPAPMPMSSPPPPDGVSPDMTPPVAGPPPTVPPPASGAFAMLAGMMSAAMAFCVLLQ